MTELAQLLCAGGFSHSESNGGGGREVGLESD